MTSTKPRTLVVTALGIGQIFAWGSSYLLPAVIAPHVVDETGWPMGWIMGALSIGLLVSGLVSPTVGRQIGRQGGRPMLVGSVLVLSVGLVVVGLAQTLAVYIGGWIVLGVGMGMGLYDPAFSTLGRLYGQQARDPITVVTMFGGFSATCCWPLSAFLVAHFGWRGTCLAYAILLMVLLLPLYLFSLPREEARIPTTAAAARAIGRVRPEQRAIFAMLAAGFTIGAAISTIVTTHLLTVLQSRGLSLAAAVAMSMLLGPTQVGARIVEIAFGRKRHPIWSLIASTLFVAGGISMLIGAPGIMAVGIVLYAAGNGFRSVARATVPLTLFDRDSYAALMGKLSLPTLVLQAAAPSFSTLVLDHWGPGGVLVLLCAMGILSFILALPLLPIALRAKS